MLIQMLRSDIDGAETDDCASDPGARAINRYLRRGLVAWVDPQTIDIVAISADVAALTGVARRTAIYDSAEDVIATIATPPALAEFIRYWDHPATGLPEPISFELAIEAFAECGPMNCVPEITAD
jgi:hypothetical protein